MANVGIIGCGGMGQYHTKSIKQVGGDTGKVVCVADVNEEAARGFAEKVGIPDWVTDYKELLRRDDVHAVFVCLPTFLHRDAVVAAAEAKKHIFCEKPIAMTLQDAQEMIDACNEAGVRFTIGFVRRFDNDWGKARELMRSGAVGRPVLWRHCTAGAGPATPWYLDKDKGGGPLVDGAVHNYDFARWTFGEAELIQGSMNTFRKDSTALDTGTGIVRFKSGDQIMLSWSWGLPGGCSGGGLMDILGPEGVISFGVPADKMPEGTDTKKYGGYLVKLADGEEKVELFERNNMFVDEVAHVLDCFANNEQPLVSGEDGKKALQIALGILESSETGESVRV